MSAHGARRAKQARKLRWRRPKPRAGHCVGGNALAIDERDFSADAGLALSTAHYHGLKSSEAQSILDKVTGDVAT